jgi:hypothetical protein
MSLIFAACMFTCIALVVLIVFPYAFSTSIALLLARDTHMRHPSHLATVAAGLGDALFVLLFVLPVASNAEKWVFLAILALLDLGFFLWSLSLSAPVHSATKLAKASMPNGFVWARFIAPVVARIAPQWHAK